MKSFSILLSLYCLLAINTVYASSINSFSSLQIALTGGPFDYPHDPVDGTRSIPSTIPFSAFLNGNHSIDLDFYQPIGEVEIVISQNGTVIYSFTEDIQTPILRNILLQPDLTGDFLLEISGSDGAYAFGWFTI